MTKSFLFTVIVLLGLCSFTADANLSKQLELQLDYNIFKDWMSQFHKPYGIEELAIRFMNWKANFDLVQEHNAKNLGWQLAMNDFGDQTPEEFSALHLGLNVHLDTRKDRNSTQTYTDDDDDDIDTDNDNLLFGSSLSAATTNSTVNKTKNNNRTKNTTYALPKSVDWRTKGAVSSVKNQGRCGGCYSFAASGALEGLYAIKNKKLINLSVQQMIDCSSAYGNNGCDGGLMTNSFEYTQRFGVESETGYGYTASLGDCKQNSKKAVFKNKGYREVPSNNVSALKRAVAKQPVSVGIEASSMTIQLYKNGIISSECGTALDHAVLIVGYGAAKNGQEYWIVKNSWGEGWGQKGYMNIAMGTQNKGAGLCGINMMASYPTL